MLGSRIQRSFSEPSSGPSSLLPEYACHAATGSNATQQSVQTCVVLAGLTVLREAGRHFQGTGPPIASGKEKCGHNVEGWNLPYSELHATVTVTARRVNDKFASEVF